MLRLDGGNGGRAFASRRYYCVKGVGSERLVFDRDVLAQSVRATISAHGATSLPQVGAVSLNFVHRWDINRQFPFAVSKKSARRKGSRVIQLSNQLSI